MDRTSDPTRHLLSPEKNVRDYLISRNDPDLKKSDWPLLEFPALFREQARRDLIQTEFELDRKRKEYIDMRQKMDGKWSDIQHLGETLKNNFIQFNEFLLVNLAKRERAKENLRNDRKFRLRTEKQCRQLVNNMEELKKHKISLDGEIGQHKMYEEYLSKVVDRCVKEDLIRNESDLVYRYEYYVQLSQQLARQSDEIFKQLQNAKTEMDKFVEHGDRVLMGLRTQAAALQGRYEEAARKVRSLEFWIGRIRDAIHDKADEISLVKSGTWNLFRMMSRRKRHPPKIKEGDVEKQLVYIKHTLGQIKNINENLAPTKSKHKKKMFASNK